MLHSIADFFRNKKVVILGFGKEGKSTFSLLQNLLPENLPSIADKNSNALKCDEIEKLSVQPEFYFGDNYLDHLDQFDVIVKSPGISLDKALIEKFRNKITSQSRIFLQHYKQNVIGVTGTKGKSTTSALIAHLLNSGGVKTILAGNIGIPVFDTLAKLTNNEKVVFEMSAHQLEDCLDSPHISVYLNLFQEHLDHFKNMQDYGFAKMNIANFQTSDDYLIYNSENTELATLLNKLSSKPIRIPFGMTDSGQNLYFIQNNELEEKKLGVNETLFPLSFSHKLKGDHNVMNMMAATAVARLFDIPGHLIAGSIATFRTLPHRLEYVGKFENIDFYNDSIATIPEASMQAVKALGNVGTLIAGGFDRGIDYSEYVDFLSESHIDNLILMDAVGLRIQSMLNEKEKNYSKIFFAEDIQKAVEMSFQHTPSGKMCLLSPAAASYGMFKNFEERGDQYVDCIKNHNKKTP
ncbi:MAG: UDP-N-acetylmuramoyl-L-alanine--D-glutamate ligase [Bacteroidota bacterium]